jgi:hypothetical protein
MLPNKEDETTLVDSDRIKEIEEFNAYVNNIKDNS